MSNNINADWVEQQYQIQLDKMDGVDDEVVIKLEPDPDDAYENERDNNL
jgi:hypothetical protein